MNWNGISFKTKMWILYRSSKLVGGENELSPRQTTGLSKEQIAEFRRRYGRRIGAGNNSNSSDRRAELIICRSGKDGPIVGCAGIEVDRIATPNGQSLPAPAPLMSNLAISKAYRRKGLAEDLVRAVENLARKEWGYEEFFLYVEKRNIPAVRLYRKLGYNNLWEDDTARTLIPTSRGGLESIPTTLICMKKSVKGPGGILERIFKSQ
jgi:RimJ/RimL family protein N-acetyltransferase